MKSVRGFVVVFLFLTALLSPLFAHAAGENASWRGKMKGLYKILGDLLTDVSSDARFFDPANRYRIENEANKLATFAHDLSDKKMIMADADPTLPIMAQMLGRETKLAADELKSGNRAYARSILRSVPSYCITCHTRNNSGPQFAKLDFEPSSDSLTPLAKGEFYAATRQFDRASAEFKKVIEDTASLSRGGREWQRAVEESLAIAVRVKKDPAKALEIVKLVQDNPKSPSFMKEDAKAWKDSILEWQKEKVPSQVTEEELYNKAVLLLGKARELQKYPMERNADILYLRASSVVHDLLQISPAGEHSSEALLLAGLSYEVLNPLKMEDLHEIFYEACVRRSPHSGLAQTCYRRLEASIIFGYTGSGGTEISNAVRERLSELYKIAEPMVNQQK